MKYLAPALVVLSLVAYTAPSGKTVFISRDQIVAIGEPAACEPGSGARVFTTNSAICVRESVFEAVSKFLVEPAK